MAQKQKVRIIVVFLLSHFGLDEFGCFTELDLSYPPPPPPKASHL